MKLLLLALSLRKDSINKKLLQIVANLIKQNKTAIAIDIETIDIADYDLISYNQDIEINKGLPEAAEKLKNKLSAVDGLVIASPEYNYSYPGFFKNIFDWVSRYQPMPWYNKKILLLSASPALAGGERGLWAIKIPFEGCGAIVFPKMFCLPLAYQAFDEQGNLIKQELLTKLKELVVSFIQFVNKLS